MKRKVLFFVLVILLCFGFTSCKNVVEMFAVKTIFGYVYLWLPSDDEAKLIGNVEEYEFELRKEIVLQESKKELQEKYPQISIFKQEDDLQLYEFLLHRTVSTRKDFVIDIILQTDEKKYSGKIESPYLSSEGGTAEFELLSEDDEKINGILIYKFWMSI